MIHLNKSLTVIDIGTNKICAAVAKMQKQMVKIINSYYLLNSSMNFGTIDNVSALEFAILNTIDNLEKLTQKQIKSITVSLPTWAFSSNIVEQKIEINGQVTLEHIARLTNRENTHFFPFIYEIDDVPVNQPVGMTGNMLSVKAHALLVDKDFLCIIKNCLVKQNVKINNIICSSYAAYLALRKTSDKGTLIDFGWSSVTIAIFNNGNIQSIYILPLGSKHITQDISTVLNISYNEAEKLKILYGVTDDFSLNEQIQINNNSISVNVLYEIISARVSEIFSLIKEYLSQNINEAYYKNIILTGGGSCMIGLPEYIHDILIGSNIKLGVPQMLLGQGDFIHSTAFSSTAGSILYATQNKSKLERKNLNKFLSIFKKLK